EVLVMDRNLNGDAIATGAADQRLFYHHNSQYSAFALTGATNAILVPAGGGAALADGAFFRIDDGSQTFTFEFDSDGGTAVSNIAIPFTAADTQDQIASAIATAIRDSGSAPDAQKLGRGVVAPGSTIEGVDTGAAPSLQQVEYAVVREGYQYDAYGQPTVFEPGTNGVVDFGGDDFVVGNGRTQLENPYLFTGRRLDDETGSYYYRTRYFDTDIGRFISRDTIGVWGDLSNLGNGYAYGANHPAGTVDPMGQKRYILSYIIGKGIDFIVCMSGKVHAEAMAYPGYEYDGGSGWNRLQRDLSDCAKALVPGATSGAGRDRPHVNASDVIKVSGSDSSVATRVSAARENRMRPEPEPPNPIICRFEPWHPGCEIILNPLPVQVRPDASDTHACAINPLLPGCELSPFPDDYPSPGAFSFTVMNKSIFSPYPEYPDNCYFPPCPWESPTRSSGDSWWDWALGWYQRAGVIQDGYWRASP
ncbi:MAG: RHS repeat-associated core domain-containing protein, partial [Candidatus Paceibacterota bacterium]